MSGSSLKSKVAKGAVWILMERLSTQGVSFVVGMILARLLTPTDYGTVALTGIFFAVAGVLVNAGFGGALIQKKNADDLDFNTVFYLQLVLATIAYIAMFFAAPWIADFYDTPVLKPIVRVSAICFFYNAINSIQSAELTKKMLFHLSFRISLITCATSAVCGVSFAFLGFGVWTFVWTQVIAGFVGVIARWFIVAWRPKAIFAFGRLKPLFSYGWKMAASALLDQFFNNLNGLLIGKFYSQADIAYVDRGRSLPNIAMSQIDSTLGQVSFPALVQLQDNKAALREAMRRMMQCSTFLVLPLMVGVCACAYSILRLLYGPQWTPAAPYMMLACFSFALWPFHTINLRAIQALGRSDLFLVLEIIKKVLALIVILSAFKLGVFAWMAISAFTLGPMGVVINAWPNRKLLNYTIGMQLRDVMPTVLVCMAEAVAVLGVGFAANVCAAMCGVSDSGGGYMAFLACKLALQAISGAATFFVLAYTFRLRPMGEYARMAATAFRYRLPRLSAALETRFAQ
ncbi:MAG: lipopolysaccharide biosynthesis protein [Kiritimatiellae bacterium]|nr:lipopolysaccharide biosynthesis protein [Kiritimatiellia bacterium]